MSSLATKNLIDDTSLPEPVGAVVTESALTVDLDDGRRIQVPTEWYPRLAHGDPWEWEEYELSPFGIHWPQLDEDIAVKGLILGEKSGESSRSFQRWLDHRNKGEKPWLEPGYEMGD